MYVCMYIQIHMYKYVYICIQFFAYSYQCIYIIAQKVVLLKTAYDASSVQLEIAEKQRTSNLLTKDEERRNLLVEMQTSEV